MFSCGSKLFVSCVQVQRSISEALDSSLWASPAILLKSTLWYAKRKGIGFSHPRQGSSGSERSGRESTSVSRRMSHLYLLESSKQMSFCSLVLHKYGTCCCISSYASQLLEYLFIKWHETDNQHSLFQGGGGHAAGKKSKAVAFAKSTDVGHDLTQSLCWPSGELQLVPSETLELGSASFFFFLLFPPPLFPGILVLLSSWLCSFLVIGCMQSFCWWQQKDCYHKNIFQL